MAGKKSLYIFRIKNIDFTSSAGARVLELFKLATKVAQAIDDDGWLSFVILLWGIRCVYTLGELGDKNTSNNDGMMRCASPQQQFDRQVAELVFEWATMLLHPFCAVTTLEHSSLRLSQEPLKR